MSPFELLRANFTVPLPAVGVGFRPLGLEKLNEKNPELTQVNEGFRPAKRIPSGIANFTVPLPAWGGRFSALGP